MTFELNADDVARVAALPAVRETARAGARLVALWPLTVAMHMDNDAKYAENLQVRITRAFARILTGEDVTVPDAEFVYEGADEIPGRPQTIVDALLTANDAYDAMADFSDTGDAALVSDAAESLGSSWSDDAAVRVRAVLESVEAAVDGGAFDRAPYTAGDGADGESVPPADDAFEPSDGLVDAVAHRFAAGLVVFDALVDAVADGGAGDVRAVLPLLLAINEIDEQIAVPRVALDDGQLRELLDVRAKAADPAGASEGTTVDALTAYLAPLAAAEWAKHRGDVLWDPAEAKKKAKEEDEKRNKEALAAKFAHIKDDPGKETVEL